MGFKHRRAAHAKLARHDRSTNYRLDLPRLVGADHRTLLTGTALASTLLMAVMTAPSPAQAAVCSQPASPTPINDTVANDSIICVNTDARTQPNGAIALGLQTNGAAPGSFINLNNSGEITANRNGGGAAVFGLGIQTSANTSQIEIINSGDVRATTLGNGFVYGLLARTGGDGSSIDIDASGDVTAEGNGNVLGVFARTGGRYSAITVTNDGDISVDAGVDGAGIATNATGYASATDITNNGDIDVDAGTQDAVGISAFSSDVFNTITISNTGDLTLNSDDDSYGISVVVYNSGSDVDIVNSGDIVATAAQTVIGISGLAYGGGSFSTAVRVVNHGDITATSTGVGYRAKGISAYTDGTDSAVDITNTGDVRVRSSANAYGIYGNTAASGSSIDIVNHGDLTVTRTGIGAFDAYGIFADTLAGNNTVTISNTGDISVSNLGGDKGIGIYARIGGSDSPIDIENRGAIEVMGGDYASGITANSGSNIAFPPNSPISITNSGDITLTAELSANGIFALATGSNSSINIGNSARISATSAGYAAGIAAVTFDNSSIGITNSGAITASSGTDNAHGIGARTFSNDSAVAITNTGPIIATSTAASAYGILGATAGANSNVSVVNSGSIAVTGMGLTIGIRADANTASSSVSIVNSGGITAQGDGDAVAIFGSSQTGSPISIVNSGDISGVSGGRGGGIVTIAPNSSIEIENSGSVYGSYAGIYSTGGIETAIVNTGSISSGALRAIKVNGDGNANIQNSGTITGFVDLTEQADMFVNQSGGLFDAKMTSFFNDGDDLFRNEAGGTVRALNVGNTGTRFDGLERFENRGTISMVDGAEGDSFTISNTPGGTDLEFVGGSGSTLAVDAFLGAPGSTSDILTIEGNVSGRTRLTVNNTNPGPGALNTVGIPVVFATGATPDAGAFFLEAPIDTGFFDYDLFFVPTGSGFWELRNFIGAGAQVLPQLLTAAQDIWHQGSSVWFDRSADLRVLLANGNAPAANLGSKSLGKSLSVPQNDGITPAVWVRGSGSWLDREDSGSTSAFGRNYRFDLDRDLETIDFQMGLDLGTRDLFSQGDALVFGMLGGFVHGGLDYDSLGRHFDFDGGQVGAYATYIKGGLFVDTLLNVHLMELNANGALGFPNNDLDATMVGLRTDTGYRFGSFSGGAFLEPLATIEVTWADIDGFSVGGNSVTFDDDANVRGRLGLRAGTTVDVWDSTIMEPFVTGSLWGTLSGDNQATLVSGGSSFRLEDQLDDVWGEVSAGVNFFNFSETTSVFAKVDVTFGDDITGVGGKAGMRVAW